MEDPQLILGWARLWSVILSTFNALTLLGGRQEGHQVCKTLGVGLLVVMI